MSDANRQHGIKRGRVGGIGIKPGGLNRPVELLRLLIGIVKKKASGDCNKRGEGVTRLFPGS